MDSYAQTATLQAIPVLQKKRVSFTIFTQLTRLFVLIDIIIRCIPRIEQANSKPLTWTDVFYTTVYLGLLICAIYVFIAPLISKIHQYPLYSAETIRDPSMACNILTKFSNIKPPPFIKRIVHNFLSPRWNDESIDIFNIAMETFYTTIGDVYSSLNNLNNSVAGIVSTQRFHSLELQCIGSKVDKLTERVDGIEKRMDGIEKRMDGIQESLGRIEALLTRNVFIVPHDD